MFNHSPSNIERHKIHIRKHMVSICRKFYSFLFKNGNNCGYATYIPEKKSRIKGGNMNTGFRETRYIENAQY